NSTESGRNEVYVAPFPGPGSKWQISTGGGDYPRWRHDGAEIFYLAPDNKLMVAAVNGKGSTFEAGVVKPLFGTRAAPGFVARMPSPPTVSVSSLTRSQNNLVPPPSPSSSTGRRG